MKYKTVNLTEKQYEELEAIRDLLESDLKGPYGGYGGSVSFGEAIYYMASRMRGPLAEAVTRRSNQKRAAANAKRTNNNPNITPGVHRERTPEPWKAIGVTRADWLKYHAKLPESEYKAPESKPEEAKSKGLFFGRLKNK